MLLIENLKVEVEGRQVLKGVNLHVKAGETHVLFGPNGAGKSTLFFAIMGYSKYKITDGKIYFKEKDITYLPTHERAKLGIGIALQRPPALKGIKLEQIGKLMNKTEEEILEKAEALRIKDMLNRDINLGFSGGEMKRSEVFQLMLQDPDLSLIDEPESGVDITNIDVIAKALRKILQKDMPILERKKSGIIITHTGFILEKLTADKGHLLIDGEIICSGNPMEIFNEIKLKGYTECLKCWKRN
ncbi:MAG: ABC transporter ATP-binding protein [Candidatus Aminicenantes bacterium]|nr:ABC transporter ATP-binding protein [Candidatus Aminicenantes bacterium]